LRNPKKNTLAGKFEKVKFFFFEFQARQFQIPRKTMTQNEKFPVNLYPYSLFKAKGVQ
jgi:hypothetical protein